MDNKRKFAEDFLTAQDLFDKIGFEIIGIKIINDEEIYFIRKKKS